MTIDEYKKKLDFVDEIVSFLGTQVAIMGNNLAADVILRVEGTGKNYKGVSFSEYSTKPMWVGSKGWLSKSKAKKFFKKAKTSTIKVEGGYSEFRTLNGLQNSHKDFSFTRMMWKGFGVKSIDVQNLKCVLGGKTDDSQDKIDWNSEREDISIITPSNDEVKNEEKRLTDIIEDFLKKELVV